jgi:hypothetical protein
MKSRFELVQDPETRRAVAIVRAGAGATIVAALMALSLFLATRSAPGPSVSDGFAAEVQFIDGAPIAALPVHAGQPSTEEAAQPPLYMGEPAVY